MTRMAEGNGYISNFFHTIEVIHKIAGLWLFKEDVEVTKKQKCLRYLWSLITFTSAIGFLVLEFMMFKETSKDVNKLIGQFGLLLSSALTIMKIYILVCLHDKLQKVIDRLLNKFYQYEAVGDYNPCQIFSESKELSRRFTILLYIIYFFVGATAHISSEISINLEVKGNIFEANTTCYDFLPYYFYIPFASDTKRKCELVFVFMNFCLCSLGCIIGCHDAFYAAVLNCLKTQLLILSGAMKTIRQRVLNRLGLPVDFQIFYDEQSPRLEEELYKELTHITQHLIILLSAAEELEAIFNLVMLGQAVISFVTFASCLFVTASIPVASPEFFTQLQYLLSLMLELGMYCWFASGITSVSEDLMFSLYDCDWYSSSKRFKSTLLITMTRMQRPICLTFGKFCPLTRSSLVSIFKSSFSYYTVFKTVDE